MDTEQNFVTSSAKSLLWRLDAMTLDCLSSRSVCLIYRLNDKLNSNLDK